jgi:hypothetical protein
MGKWGIRHEPFRESGVTMTIHPNRSGRFVLLIFALCVLPFAPTALAGETYHSANNGFSVTMPDGWSRLSDAMVQRLKDAAFTAQGQSRGQIEAVYVPKGGSLIAGTYVTITAIPYPINRQPNDREVQEAFDAMTPANAKEAAKGNLTPQARQLLDAMTIKTSNLDQQNKSFQLVVEIKGPGKVVQSHSFGFFGKHAMIQINGATTDADPAAHDATFANMAQSFVFDAAEAYDKRLSAAFDSGKLLGQIGAIGIFALIAAFVVKKVRGR